MDALPAAAGGYSVPIAKLADMLAAAPSVQARFGTIGDTAATVARIHYPAVEDDQVPNLMPCLVLGPGDRWEWNTESGGAQNYLLPSGSILLLGAVRSNYPDLEAGQRDVANFVGELTQDLANVAAASGQLAIDRLRQLFPPARCTKEHEAAVGRYFMFGLFADWGVVR